MRRAKYSAKKVYLPNASRIGFGEFYAKPGFWLAWTEQGRQRHGRVLGRIESAEWASGAGTADVAGFIAVMSLGDNLTHAFVRWVDPAHVTDCVAKPPRALMAWITGEEWPKRGADVARLIAMSEYGTCSEEYIESRNDPEKPYNKFADLPDYINQFVIT